MKLSILAVLAIVIGVGTAAHAGCATSTCLADEQPTSAQGALERRIENALKDLEIFNARALKTHPQAKDSALERRIESALKDLESATARTLRADQERQNELVRRSGIER
jgi:hypothetical protein